MYKNRTLNLYFLFANFAENSSFWKSDKHKLGNKQNEQIAQFVSYYLASLSNFLTKMAKISQITECLHSLFTQFWEAIFYLFEVLVLKLK